MSNYRYDGSKRFSIKGFDCADTGEFSKRHETIKEFVSNLEEINEYQQKLFAEKKEGIIFVFQAMDAAGKDGAVRAVLSCLSPQGVSEHSFKVPSSTENNHDYLWRFWSAIPGKGSISIFNRSYYEDVLVQKVHKIYEKNKYADRIDRSTMIDDRYEQIRNFEKYLWENSIRVVKIFLNVSREEQARRFISRIDTPKKNWKFSSSDIDEREYWDEYMDAYQTCINRTARKNAPWYVVPADHKWYARLIISRIVLEELKNMDPQWPVLDDEEMEKLNSYRERLIGETELKEEERESGKKLRPSDTAVGLALRDDRKNLSEKKFAKQLKKTVFDNFCDRFGVSEQTQEELGRVYLTCEEAEARAESADLDELKELFDGRYEELSAQLQSRGKEAGKLLKRYKKASRIRIKAFKEQINIGYVQLEDELRRYMTEYEIAVGAEGADAAEALEKFSEELKAAYEKYRSDLAEKKTETESELIRIAEEYAGIGAAFLREEEKEKSEEETSAEEETPENV